MDRGFAPPCFSKDAPWHVPGVIIPRERERALNSCGLLRIVLAVAIVWKNAPIMHSPWAKKLSFWNMIYAMAVEPVL
jgi:hypothetical protein